VAIMKALSLRTPAHRFERPSSIRWREENSYNGAERRKDVEEGNVERDRDSGEMEERKRKNDTREESKG